MDSGLVTEATDCESAFKNDPRDSSLIKSLQRQSASRPHADPHRSGPLKIWVLSDLHNEFTPMDLDASVEADVLVLAGDIDVGDRAIRWLAEHRPRVPVIYIAGNHEFYGGGIARSSAAIKDAVPPPPPGTRLS